MCGGTSGQSSPNAVSTGLSPRVRGNQRCQTPTPRCGRSIPACAGEPPAGCGRRYCRWVYPRVCGGTSGAGGKCSAWPGLSPRVRGNRSVTAALCVATGSIPACAGEPPDRRIGKFDCRVYPRVCGGTISDTLARGRGRGLSPRVRGNRPCEAAPGGGCRSIPACAGEPHQHRQRH